MDWSPPGSSVHGILQARILEWVAISFSRGSSWRRDRTWVSCIAGRFFTIWSIGKSRSKRHHQIRPFRLWIWLLVLRLWPFNKISMIRKAVYDILSENKRLLISIISFYTDIYMYVCTHTYTCIISTHIWREVLLHIIYIYMRACAELLEEYGVR